MTPSERKLYDRLRRRATMLQPDLARRLLSAYGVIRDALTEAELLRAINAGYVEALIDAILADKVIDPAFMPLRNLVDRAALDGGASWAKTLPGRVAAPVFDVLNPRILDAVKQLDSRVIQGLKTEVRDTVRKAMTAQFEAGTHPRATARLIRDVIGLAPNQVDAIQNFRNMLEARDREALTRALRDKRFDATLQRMLGGDVDLQAKQIDAMVAAYQRKMLAFNTQTHTRTIANDTQKLAQKLSWTNAVDQGYVDGGSLVRVWVTVGDDRVRPEHQAMNGEEVPFEGGVYSNGETIPGESTYNCRCIERITLRALRAA